MTPTNTYTTISGDTWDMIAFKTLGNEMLTDSIITANRQYRTVFIFDAGVELVIPQVTEEFEAGLPPWIE